MDPAYAIMRPVSHPRPAVAQSSPYESVGEGERTRLYHLAYGVLRDMGEAEDAVQESLLRAWQQWDSLREDGDRSAWLTRICINACLDRRRKLGLRRFFPGVLMPLDHPAMPDPRLGGHLVDLDRAYCSLSPRQRAATFLTYHYGYTPEECATLMGCGAGSVRTHLARALRNLRKELIHDGR